jgi:hypothetical protein
LQPWWWSLKRDRPDLNNPEKDYPRRGIVPVVRLLV